MELMQYIKLFRRWFWLIALGGFLAGGAAYLQTSRQIDLYQAETTLSVGTSIQTQNPGANDIYTGQELAQNYVVLARKNVVLQGAIETYDLPISVSGLRGALSAQVVPDTTFLDIRITHPDPVLAVEMADAVAQQLIENSPSNLTPDQEAQVALATAEIERLTGQLTVLRERLNTIEQQLDAATTSEEIDRLNEQYDTLVNQINSASNNIAWFSDTLARIRERTNSLTVVEPARLLGQVPRSTFQRAVLGMIVGMSLAVGIALLVEYLDDSIRTPEDVRAVMELPTIAMIPLFGKRQDSYPERLIAYRKPDTPPAEEYRTLRTNLMFSSNGSKASYIITSPGPGDGKTVTACNLAVTIATAGWRVLLIDADLRRPRVHDVFNMDNQMGLSTLLSAAPEDLPPMNAPLFDLPSHLEDCIQESEIPGLYLIPSGYLPLNPAEVLGSAAMHSWYERFTSSPDVDVVVFDSPPVLVAADGMVLASTLAAPVILVLEAGRARPGPTSRARERLASLEIDIRGVVLNAVSARDQAYGYGYDYYYYYYKSQQPTGRPATPEQNGRLRRRN